MSEEIIFYSSEKDYDKRFSTFFGRFVNDRQMRIVHDFLVGDGLILDLACGTGRFLNCMDEESLGLDASDMIWKADGKVVRADASHMPLDNESVNYCICVNAFNHFSEYKNVLEEMSRVLKPNGLLLMNYSNILSPAIFVGLLVNMRHKALFKNVYTRWDTYGSIAKMLKESGLKIVSSRGMTCMGPLSYSIFVEAKKVRREKNG